MIDNFFGGITDEMQAVLDALAKQNRQQQEPPTPAEYTTDQTIQGLEANKAAQQPQLQPLSPDQYYWGNQIAQAKGAFENADVLARQLNPTVTDEAQLNALADQLRNNSHQFADNIRQITKALGTDLSGIEDVSYADAARNLQTRQAKEVVDIMSRQGKYGRTAEQYYQDEYLKLGADGYSARNARRIAGERAQRYQADRVTYLRNAFNMYGRDGNYINDNGMAMIQEIAGEMPEVAQVYWGAYKHPDQAQDRLETLYDENLGQLFTEKNAAQQFGYNRILQGDTHRYNIESQNVGSQLRREEAQWQNDLDFVRFVRENGYSEAQAQRLYEKKLTNAYDLVFNKLGFSGKDAQAALANVMGINVLFGKDGKAQGTPGEGTVKNISELYGKIISYRESLLKQLEDAKKNDATDKKNNRINAGEIDTIKQQIVAVDTQLAQLQNLGLLGIAGIQTQPQQSTQSNDEGWKPNITGNWDNDRKELDMVDEAMKRQGYSVEQRRQGLYELVIENGYTPEMAQGALGISAEEAAKWQKQTKR